VKHIASLVRISLSLWDTVYPHALWAFNKGQWAYNQLPEDLIPALLGLLLCFFGGTFAALIAAVEAFRLTGYEQTKASIAVLRKEYLEFKKKNDQDEKEDKDGNGVADVQQKSASELLLHKTQLFLASVEDPKEISNAITGIFASCLSVVAVLRVEFAKTVTLGVSIGNYMQTGAEHVVLPALCQVTPKKYAQWLPTVVSYVCKSIAIAIAWYIQKVISAIHSGIRGGLMFSRNVFVYCNRKGYFHLKHEETNIDEVVGWLLAGLGVYFQIHHGFSLPFPLNILMFPLTFVEWAIIWCVSDTSIQV
jgi:hypothetical protein